MSKELISTYHEIEVGAPKKPIVEKLQLLEEHGVVTKVIGDIKDDISTGLVLWANRPPGPGFDAHILLSHYLSEEAPYIIIDDVLPMTVFRRDQNEQKRATDEYLRFFGERGCKIELISDFFTREFNHQPLPALTEIANRLSLSQFLQALPERKIQALKDLTLTEILHTLNALLVFEHTRQYANTLIMPHFSQAILALHRNICSYPLSGIFTPSFKDDKDIRNRITIVNGLKRQNQHCQI